MTEGLTRTVCAGEALRPFLHPWDDRGLAPEHDATGPSVRDRGPMRELVALVGWLVGWLVGIQGVLGIAGRSFGDHPWGLLHRWWDIPTPGYAVLALGAPLSRCTGRPPRPAPALRGPPLTRPHLAPRP